MENKIFETLNGEKINYYDSITGSKTLLLIHGNTSSSLFFKPLWDRLPKDIRIIAPDLRGFGNSSYNNRFDTLEELANDVEGLIEHLDLVDVTVLGWSLGGGVAMELALSSKRISKLILLASTDHKGYPVFKKDENNYPLIGEVYETKEAMANDPVQVLPLLGIIQLQDIKLMNYIYDNTIYKVKKPNDIDKEIYAKEALKQRCLVDADWAISNFNLSNVHNGYTMGNNKISKLKLPILHLWGKDDIMVPKFMLDSNFNETINNSQIIIYDNCSHSPFVDIPDQLTSDILDFIIF